MAGTENVLGVDVGGVILDFLRSGKEDPAYIHRHLDIPPVEDSIESVTALNASDKFNGNVFLVSRYRGDGPREVLEWLHHQRFFERTNIPEDHFYPCAERHEKLPIARKLGVTHFVDDRAEVLKEMIGTVPHLYLFQNLDEKKDEFADARRHMRFFKTWNELLPVLLE